MINLPARVHACWSTVIAPPELADPARSKRAQMLHAILLTVFVTQGALLLIGAPFVFVRKIEGGILVAVVLLAAVFSWWCMRRGALGLASHALTWTLWIIYSMMLLLSDSANLGLYIPIVFIAAVLLGPAWAAATGLWGIGIAVLVIFGRDLGVHLPRYFPAPPAVKFLLFSTQAILATGPFYVIGRSLMRALERAGRELKERTLAQQQLQHSENRLTLALEAAHTGIWEWHIADGRFTTTPQAEAVFGLQQGEFGGTYEAFLRLVHPEDGERVTDFNRGLREGRMRGRVIEYRIICRDGSMRWIEGRGTLQHDAAGAPACVIGTAVDITSRTLAEHALQESENRYRAMIGTMAEGTMLHDMEGNLLLCNPAAERIIGLRAEEMTRWTFPRAGWRTIREDGTPFLRDEHPVMITLRTGLACAGVVMGIQRGDGPWTWISINSVALRRDNQNKLYAVLITLTDITQRKNAQQMLDRERILLRTLVDNLPDDIFIIDTGGRYTMMNSAWLAQVGCAVEKDVLGKTVFDFFDAAAATQFDAENRRIIATGIGLYNQRRPIQKDDGGKRWVLTSKIPMRDVGGQIAGIIGINRDVTELHNALDTFQQERNLLRSIIDSAPDAIYVKDRQLRYLLMNEAGMRKRNLNRHEEIIGKTARDYFAPEIASAIEAEELELTNSGRPIVNSHRRSREAGSADRWISMSKYPIADAAGAIVGLVTIQRDITDLKNMIEEVGSLNLQLEDRVRLRTQELQEVNKELEAFSYSVSHDLRAPLRSILGFGNFMRQDNLEQLDAEGKARLERILAASTRMSNLIDDLLALARISRRSVCPRRVDLNALASEVVAVLSETSPERRVDIVIAPELSVEADAGLMRIVLDNLLGNAWKFTGRCADARIQLGVENIDGKTAYFVRDNGAGFDMSYAGKLFAPFQRMHTQQQFEGTGIGLATVKRIIERHHGRIWLESAVDAGTTVYFTVGAPA